jgi:hypothetical protein
MKEDAGSPRTTLADALDRVRWEYDPVRGQVSPLVPTALYFQDFPWDGPELEDGDPPGFTPAGLAPA